MYTTVKPGQMLGYIAVARGITHGREVITYKLIMHAGVEEGYEEYIIEWIPNIRVKMSEFLGDWETGSHCCQHDTKGDKRQPPA